MTPTKTQLALCRLHLRTWASIPAMKLSAGPLSLFLVPGRKFGLASPPLPAADLLLYSNAEQCMRQQTSHLQDRQILCSIDSSHECVLVTSLSAVALDVKHHVRSKQSSAKYAQYKGPFALKAIACVLSATGPQMKFSQILLCRCVVLEAACKTPQCKLEALCCSCGSVEVHLA